MFQSDILLKILHEVKEKHIINSQQVGEHYELYIESELYFDAIKDEVDESKKENRDDNTIYLEDELGDIFWNYANLLYFLEKEGKISARGVMDRCLKKYKERTDGLKKGISWNEVKKEQKQKLLEEHNKKYNA